jgi:hypothetical protein
MLLLYTRIYSFIEAVFLKQAMSSVLIVRFQVFMAENVKMTVFWFMALVYYSETIRRYTPERCHHQSVYSFSVDCNIPNFSQIGSRILEPFITHALTKFSIPKSLTAEKILLTEHV